MKIDKEYEVSIEAYNILKVEFSGIVAHRSENGKHYIKLWVSRYSRHVELVIDKYPFAKVKQIK